VNKIILIQEDHTRT